jgi:outer membrane protein assembly factor BamB
MTAIRASSLAVLIATGCAADPAVPAPGATLFVTDRGGNAILRYDAISGAFEDVFAAGSDAHVDRPSSVRIGPDGHVYLAAFGKGEIVRYDATSTAMMGVFYADTGALEEPVELLFHGEELVVLGNDTNNVVVLDAAGTLVQNFGAPDMLGAHDMAIGPDGMLYVGLPSSVERGTALQVWDLATGTMRRDFGTYDQLASGTGIAFGDGMIYVADHERDQIVQFDAVTGGPRGALVTEGLVAPVSVDVGPDGALYIVDAEGVKRFADGALSTFIHAGDGHVVSPRSVTFAP